MKRCLHWMWTSVCSLTILAFQTDGLHCKSAKKCAPPSFPTSSSLGIYGGKSSTQNRKSGTVLSKTPFICRKKRTPVVQHLITRNSFLNGEFDLTPTLQVFQPKKQRVEIWICQLLYQILKKDTKLIPFRKGPRLLQLHSQKVGPDRIFQGDIPGSVPSIL